MRRALLAFLVSVAPSGEAAAQRDSIAALVDRHMRERGIPGLSLAIGHRGQVVHAEGFGLADLEHDAPVTPATRFRLQSTQKLLTAAAVLRLAELGRLRLDDPVQGYCPAFGARPWPVTPRQLLSHQGGVRPSDLADLFNRTHYPTVAAALRRFVREPLAHRPGTKVLYSNAGYTLLACAVEGATGQPYDSALARLILRPAGMVETGPDNVYDVVAGRSRYYVVRTAANTEQWRGLWTEAHLAATPLDRPASADPVDPSWAAGAGSYLGTPSDLVRFGLAILGGRVLRGYRDSVFAQTPLDATGEPTGRALGGWVVDPEGRGVARLLGSSWNGSFGVAVDSASGIVVAVASNIEFDQPEALIGRILTLWRR
jgi:serine beta-lactamase-like protein LACTB